MSTIDRVKEESGLLKLFLAGLIAIDVSLIAWLAQDYGRANRLVWAPIAALVIFLIGLGIMLWDATREIPTKRPPNQNPPKRRGRGPHYNLNDVVLVR
jgi:uncharacterized iron-regulated membrane protein